MAEALRWWLAIQALSLLVLPLCGLVFRALPDRGYSLSKAFGWLLVGWITWLAATLGLMPFSRTSAVACGLLVGVFSLAALFLHRGGRVASLHIRAWPMFLRERGAMANPIMVNPLYVIAVEGIFLVAFIAMVMLRSYVPEISGTEKPMEFMQLHSLLSSGEVPPSDLWMSGHPINYYYFGFFLNALLARLGDVTPEVAFNLSLAGTWATTFVALAGLGYNAIASSSRSRVPRLLGALLPPLLVLLMGNVAGTLRGLGIGREAEGGPAASGFEWWRDGWSATRVIIDTIPRLGGQVSTSETINEFPAFSYLLGDLHPHVMSMPVVALGLAASLALMLSCGRPRSHTIWTLGFAGMVTGWLYMTNSWDVPIVVALVLAAAGWAVLHCARSHADRRAQLRGLAAATAGLAAMALLVSLPFLLHFDAPVDSNAELPQDLTSLPVINRLGRYIGVVWWTRTSLGEFAKVWGVQFLVLLAALAVSSRTLSRRAWGWIGLAGAVAALAAVPLRAPVFILIPLIAACFVLARRSELPAERWAYLLAAAGWSLVLLPEVVYIRDVFESRMNTVFKFYFQAWQILGVSSALLLIVAADRLAIGAGRRWRLRAVIPITAAVLMCLSYPYAATRSRVENGYQGLRGAAFLESADRDAAAATRWLLDHSEPGDVVLEATGGAYSLYGRLATFGGRPGVLGWANHERQWRLGQPELYAEIGTRDADIKSLYSPGDAANTAALLTKYDVRYAYYGQLEREMQLKAKVPVEDPFEGVYEPAARFLGSVLYQVR